MIIDSSMHSLVAFFLLLVDGFFKGGFRVAIIIFGKLCNSMTNSGKLVVTQLTRYAFASEYLHKWICGVPGNPRINLLVLDLEGADLDVLRTIPWQKVGPHTLYTRSNTLKVYTIHQCSEHPNIINPVCILIKFKNRQIHNINIDTARYAYIPNIVYFFIKKKFYFL